MINQLKKLQPQDQPVGCIISQYSRTYYCTEQKHGYYS